MKSVYLSALLVVFVLNSCTETVPKRKTVKVNAVPKNLLRIISKNNTAGKKCDFINLNKTTHLIQLLNSSSSKEIINGIHQIAVTEKGILIFYLSRLLLNSNPEIRTEAYTKIAKLPIETIKPFLVSEISELRSYFGPEFKKIKKLLGSDFKTNLRISPQLLYKISLSPKSFPSMPVVKDGILYFNYVNNLVAFDPFDRKILWTLNINKSKYSPLRFKDHYLLYQGVGDGKKMRLNFINRFTGDFSHSVQIPDWFVSNIVSGGSIFILKKNNISKNGFVITDKSGKKIWGSREKICGIVNDIVITQSGTKIEGFYVKNGHKLWTHKGALSKCRISIQKKISIQSKDQISFINPVDGKLIWQTPENHILKSGFYGRRMWVLDAKNISVYNSDTGKLITKIKVGFLGTPAFYRNIVIYWNSNKIAAYNLSNLNLLWKKEMDKLKNVYIKMGKVIGYSGNNIEVISLKSGKLLKSHSLGKLNPKSIRFEGLFGYAIGKTGILSFNLKSGMIGRFINKGKMPLYCGSLVNGTLYCGTYNSIQVIKFIKSF